MAGGDGVGEISYGGLMFGPVQRLLSVPACASRALGEHPECAVVDTPPSGRWANLRARLLPTETSSAQSMCRPYDACAGFDSRTPDPQGGTP